MKPEINLTAPGTSGARPTSSLYEWTIRTAPRKPASLTPVQPMPIPPVGGEGLPSDIVSKAELPYFINTAPKPDDNYKEWKRRARILDLKFGKLFKQEAANKDRELKIVYHPDGSEVPPALNTLPPTEGNAYKHAAYQPGTVRCYNSNGEFNMITMPDTIQRLWAKMFRSMYDFEFDYPNLEEDVGSGNKGGTGLLPIGLGLYRAGKGMTVNFQPSAHIAFGKYKAEWRMRVNPLAHRKKVEVGKFQDLAAWAWMKLEDSWNGGSSSDNGRTAGITITAEDSKGETARHLQAQAWVTYLAGIYEGYGDKVPESTNMYPRDIFTSDWTSYLTLPFIKGIPNISLSAIALATGVGRNVVKHQVKDSHATQVIADWIMFNMCFAMFAKVCGAHSAMCELTVEDGNRKYAKEDWEKFVIPSQTLDGSTSVSDALYMPPVINTQHGTKGLLIPAPLVSFGGRKGRAMRYYPNFQEPLEVTDTLSVQGRDSTFDAGAAQHTYSWVDFNRENRIGTINHHGVEHVNIAVPAYKENQASGLLLGLCYATAGTTKPSSVIEAVPASIFGCSATQYIPFEKGSKTKAAPFTQTMGPLQPLYNPNVIEATLHTTNRNAVGAPPLTKDDNQRPHVTELTEEKLAAQKDHYGAVTEGFTEVTKFAKGDITKDEVVVAMPDGTYWRDKSKLAD